MNPMDSRRHTEAFIDAKIRGLVARARRLSRLTKSSLGLRDQDIKYCPSTAHFEAVNARLESIDSTLRKHLDELRAMERSGAPSRERLLHRCALVEREVDRARRTYGLFFEVFAQRGTGFAPALAACDVVAADCFAIVRRSAPGVLHGPLLKPVTYLEHGFSPATFRRGVMLSRLLGETNPFPLVRVPYERVHSPWGMGVLLHEIGHNLQADMTIWQETRAALQRRVLSASKDPWTARIWSRWHKEIFADLIALLLGGPASARAMMDFLSYTSSRVLTFRPLSVHPTPYVRTFIMAEMMRRMGFDKEAQRSTGVWKELYDPRVYTARIPKRLLDTAPRIIPHVVDEIAYQTRRGLGQRTLSDVVPFTEADQREILRVARALGEGQVPAALPPRFLISASRYAFDERFAPAERISNLVLEHLAKTATRTRNRRQVPLAAAA